MPQCPLCDRSFDERTGVCPDDGAFLGAPDPALGFVVDGKYRVDALIGRGGMGAVFRATQLSLDRAVALKVVRGPSEADGRALKRFRREALLVAKLNHPAVVAIYDFGENPDFGTYLVMELLRGRPLRTEIRARGRYSPAEAAALVAFVCRPFAAAHAAGIVHRDLKPDNLFVMPEGDGPRIKVLDFGLAKLASGDEGYITYPGLPPGTPLYMSPEQCSEMEVDARSDIYALGCVFHELLTGRPPFTGGSVSSILLRQMSEPSRPPSTFVRGIPAAVDAIVARCLMKERDERFQSMDDLALALAEVAPTLADASAPSIPRPAAPVAALTYVALPVGRDLELGALRSRLERAADGEGQFVLITGDVGVGKTRLLEEVERMARARGAGVAHGRFAGADRIFPFNGFCDVFEELFSAGRGPEFADLIPDLAALFPTLCEHPSIRGASWLPEVVSPRRAFEDRGAVFEVLARALLRVAGSRPHVILFEDLQDANVSIDALAHIAPRLKSMPLLIVATARTVEGVRASPLAGLVRDLRGDPAFCPVTLGPLRAEAHRELLRTLVGGSPPDAAVASALFDATEGNPYFTKELVRSLVERGLVSRDAGGPWAVSTSAIGPETLPATILEAVDARLERLPAKELELLTVASVLGRTFRQGDLERLAGEQDAGQMIDDLVDTRFLDEDRTEGSDGLAFTSTVVRDALYARLTRRRRRALHRAHATHLEARWAGREDRIRPQLVHHFAQAEVHDRVVAHALHLATDALSAFAPEDAERAARLALEHLALEEAPDPTAGLEAASSLAGALRMSGNATGALGALAPAIRASPAAAPASFARALALAAEVAWDAREVDIARSFVADGLIAVRSAGEAGCHARLLSIGTLLANLVGARDQAQALIEEARTLDGVAAAPRPAPHGAAADGAVTVAYRGQVHSLDPAHEYQFTHSEVVMTIFDTLTRSGDQAQIMPWLCETFDADQGGRRFRFRLREGLRFQNGRAVTSRDVRKSFERVLRGNFPGRPLLATIRGAEALRAGAPRLEGFEELSPLAFAIGLDEPMSFFPAVLTTPTASILPEGVAPSGQSWRDGFIGTGPFRLARFEPGVSVELEANPDYWRPGLPKVKTLTFRFGLDNTLRAKGMAGGEYSLAWQSLGEHGASLLRDPAFVRGRRRSPALSTFYVAPNVRRGQLADDETRRRFASACDVANFDAETIHRFGTPATGLIPPGLLGHGPSLRSQGDGDVAKRRRRLTVFSNGRWAEMLAILTPFWAAAGFDVDLVTTRTSEYTSTAVAALADVVVGSWDADYPDADTFVYGLLHSREGFLGPLCGTPEIDRLAESARRETDPAVRHALYREVEAVVARESLIVPIFHRFDEWLARPEVGGLETHFFFPSILFEQLYVSPLAPLPDGPSIPRSRP